MVGQHITVVAHLLEYCFAELFRLRLVFIHCKFLIPPDVAAVNVGAGISTGTMVGFVVLRHELIVVLKGIPKP